MEVIDLFDKYISGELPPSEKEVFEARLKSDKDFQSEFRLYVASIIGICREAEQDNKDFEEAMRRISKEELLSIIKHPTEDFDAFRNRVIPAASSTAYSKAYQTKADNPSRFRKWLTWQSIGIAALLGIGVIYVIIARNEANTARQNAFAVKQGALDKVDNAIYAFSGYSQGIARSGGIDISTLSDEDLKVNLPSLEANFREQTDDTDIAEYGSELAMAYIRLHERDKAKELLTELVTRFKNNSDFEEDVINWKTILSLLQ